MAETTKPAAKTTLPKLPKEVFAVDVKNHELLKLAYDAYLANNRGANATTLQRGEVRGGGKKPWRQKGTGRARFGSTRNPIWRGGGVVFGPRGNENYTKKVPTQAKRLAVRQALTLANEAKKVQVLPIASKATAKTRDAVAYLADSAKIDTDVHTTLIVAEKTPELIRSTANLQNVILVSPTYVTVFHVLNADKIVFDTKAVPLTTQWLTGGTA